MGTYFSSNCSGPASASSMPGANRIMTASSDFVNKQAPSISGQYETSHKYTPTNQQVATKVNSTNNSDNENCMIPKVQIERLHSPSKFDALSDKTKKESIESEALVDVAKLLAQLMNAKVVLKKLEKPLAKYPVSQGVQTNVDFHDEKDIAGGSNCNDYATSYCAKCKKTKYTRVRDPTVKNCPGCKTAMTYLCTKCNEKYYRRYPFLLLHLDRCEGRSNVDDTLPDEIDHTDSDIKDQSTSEAKLFLKKSQFIVKEFRAVDMSKKWKRYCPKCGVKSANSNDRRCTCVGTLLFKCMKCDSTYNSMQALHYHLSSQCYPTAQYKCTHCKYFTTCWQNMQKHFRFLHTELSLIKCKFCSYETKYKGTLNIHIKNMHDYIDNKFYCSSCTYSTKFERNLRRHKQLHH